MFVIKLTDTRDHEHISNPLDSKEEGLRQLDQTALGGRFVKAELWSGELVDGEWVDDTLVKDTASVSESSN